MPRTSWGMLNHYHRSAALNNGPLRQRLFVPIDAIDKSLRECDFRRQYKSQVIAIEERDGSLQCSPDLDRPLSSDQRLLDVVRKSSAS